MKKKTIPGIAFFNTHAAELAAQYNALDRAAVHADLLHHMQQDKPLKILDVGAGSGADAAFFAAQGHHVTACEPALKLRQIAQKTFPHSSIVWSGASLPALGGKQHRKAAYDVVTSTGVIQYLDPSLREKAFLRMAQLTAPGGLIEIQFPTPPSRPHQYEMDADEICRFVGAFNLAVDKGIRLDILIDKTSPDLAGRKALNGKPLSFVSMLLRKRGP